MSSSQPTKAQAIGQIIVDAVNTALPVASSLLKVLGLGDKGPDETVKKEQVEAAIEKERVQRLTEAQAKLSPLVDLSVELATLNAFLKLSIMAQERIIEMVEILSAHQQPSEAIWQTLSNKWEDLLPILRGFADVPENDINKVRDVTLRVNLYDLRMINNEFATQIGQFIEDKNVAGLTDRIKDASRAIQLFFRAAGVEMSTLQNDVGAVAPLLGTPPATESDGAANSALRQEREEIDAEVNALRKKYSGSEEDQWCFAWFAEVEGSEGLKSRGALLKSAKWPRNHEITISFLDGDPALQERVKREAMTWVGSGMARLTLAFMKDTNDTDIRISFKYRGSWSAIGTTCHEVTDKAKPTMNFGRLKPNSPDEMVRRVVLHEFGHALGLIHEHQNPNGHVNWNRDAVIRDLSGPPNYWNMDKIHKNMFRPYEMNEVNSTPLDANSIMMYPIPKTWTTDGTSVGLNSDLSEADKEFIRQEYP